MLKDKGYTTALFGKWHVGLTFLDTDGNRITKGGNEGVKRIDFTRPIPDAPVHRGFDRFFGTACCPTTDWLYAFIDGDESPEKSAVFHSTNAGKRLITLNLNSAEGKAVALDLVRWADVVTESFSPKAMSAFGLDYESLREVNPSVIMLSTCLMGQTGPLAMFAGYGNLAAAIAGFYEIAGWDDREPAGPFGAYTDYIAPRYNAAAILAALDHRRRTGEGQHIDLAQAEAAMHFLTPAILDYTANGRVQGRDGNADPNFAPHGVYPTAGEDRHIAIACETDAQWKALCEVLPQMAVLSADTQDERLAQNGTLDTRLATLTSTLDGQAPKGTRSQRLPADQVDQHALSTNHGQ